MARLSILVAGGTEEEREALTSELIEKLALFTRTDDGAPRLRVTSDDPDDIRLRTLTTIC